MIIQKITLFTFSHQLQRCTMPHSFLEDPLKYKIVYYNHTFQIIGDQSSAHFIYTPSISPSLRQIWLYKYCFCTISLIWLCLLVNAHFAVLANIDFVMSRMEATYYLREKWDERRLIIFVGMEKNAVYP